MPAWLFNAATLSIVEANSAAQHLYGYNRDEFLSRKVTELFQAEDRPTFLDLVARNQPGLVRGGVWRHQTKNVQELDVELFWGTLNAASQPFGILFAYEITERRWAEQILTQVHTHTEEQLANRTSELDLIAQELDSFAHALLRLTFQSGSVGEPLCHGPARQYLEQMSQSLRQLAQLTYVQARPAEIDLSAIARQVADEMNRTNTECKITFKILAGITTYADAELMRLMLTHLFRNACFYTRQSLSAQIEFGARAEEDEVVCFVRDNGSGFEPAMAEKLFLPFQDFSAGLQSNGVGLSIVRRIIAKHSGRLWAEGAPQQGATIFFSLPRAK